MCLATYHYDHVFDWSLHHVQIDLNQISNRSLGQAMHWTHRHLFGHDYEYDSHRCSTNDFHDNYLDRWVDCTMVWEWRQWIISSCSLPLSLTWMKILFLRYHLWFQYLSLVILSVSSQFPVLSLLCPPVLLHQISKHQHPVTVLERRVHRMHSLPSCRHWAHVIPAVHVRPVVHSTWSLAFVESTCWRKVFPPHERPVIRGRWLPHYSLMTTSRIVVEVRPMVWYVAEGRDVDALVARLVDHRVAHLKLNEVDK